MELLDKMVILFSSFWGIAILFSTDAISFYIPTNGSHVLNQFLHILANSCNFFVLGFFVCFDIYSFIYLLFESIHPNEYKVLYNCGLDLHFPSVEWCEEYYLLLFQDYLSVLAFKSLIMCFKVGLYISLGVSWSSWIFIFIPFIKFGNGSAIISSNILFSLSLSSPGNPMMHMLLHLKVSHRSPVLFTFL